MTVPKCAVHLCAWHLVDTAPSIPKFSQSGQKVMNAGSLVIVRIPVGYIRVP